MLATLNRDHHRTVFIHNVYRTEIPTINFKRLAMVRRGVPFPLVESICLHKAAVGNTFLQRLDHIAGQNVGPLGFAGVQLNGRFSCDTLADSGVGFQQAIRADIFGEKNLSFGLWCIGSTSRPLRNSTGKSTKRNRAILQIKFVWKFSFSSGISFR